MHLSPGQIEHLADFVVEFAGFEQLLDCQVHAVAPVVIGIGGYVDALGGGILVSEL